MSQSIRAELAALLKRVAEHRRRIKELQESLERLYARIGYVRAQGEYSEMKAGPRKTSRKK
jgi:uncharacterized coiled-coil protein SlyX